MSGGAIFSGREVLRVTATRVVLTTYATRHHRGRSCAIASFLPYRLAEGHETDGLKGMWYRGGGGGGGGGLALDIEGQLTEAGGSGGAGDIGGGGGGGGGGRYRPPAGQVTKSAERLMIRGGYGGSEDAGCSTAAEAGGCSGSTVARRPRQEPASINVPG